MTLVSINSTVAYFSMEICLDQAIPTYSGGLGVLAGDTLRSAADLGVPVVARHAAPPKGYFEQHLDAAGQSDRAPVRVESRGRARACRRARDGHDRRPHGARFAPGGITVRGVTGHEVPVYLLDTQLAGEHASGISTLTDYLYGGDSHYRLCQEVVLGMGGAATAARARLRRRRIYHLNEGHSALLTLCLLEWQLDGRKPLRARRSPTSKRCAAACVFTTHTPVPAGHDKFPLDMVRRVLGDEQRRAARGGAVRR